MSSTVTLKAEGSKYVGKIVLTNYGRTRMLERVAYDANFVDFNFTSIGIGNKINTTYTADITKLGNEILSFPIDNSNVFYSDYVTTIKVNLDLEGEIRMQEIGLYETLNGVRKLFAYASGFSMVKSEKISYDLIIDLGLSFTFENESPSKYNIKLRDVNYALMPRVDKMHKTLFESHLDLERSIEINSRLLGYNTPQVYMLTHNKDANILNDLLLISRYNKTVKNVGLDNMTDCFYFPEHLITTTLRDKYIDKVGRLYTYDESKNNFTSEEWSGGKKVEFESVEQDGVVGIMRNNRFLPLTIIKYTQTPVNYTLKNLSDNTINRYIDLNKNIYIYSKDAYGEYFTDKDGNKYNRVDKIDEGIGSEDIKVTGYMKDGVFYRLEELPLSEMSVTGDLQLCNRDNINLSSSASIAYTGVLNNFSKESFIFGKMNPNEDQYYFDLRVVNDKDRERSNINSWGLQFTIYSYDKASEIYIHTDTYNEWDIVGHYRITYFPTDTELSKMVNSENLYTFVYNGDIENPEVKLYIGTTLVNNSTQVLTRYAFEYTDDTGVNTIYADSSTHPSKLYYEDGSDYDEDEFVINNNVVYYNEHPTTYKSSDNISSNVDNFIVDNFNYMGPCEYFRETCTLRNYSQTTNLIDFSQPMYYLIPEVKSSSFMAFNKALNEDEISYLALISQS